MLSVARLVVEVSRTVLGKDVEMPVELQVGMKGRRYRRKNGAMVFLRSEVNGMGGRTVQRRQRFLEAKKALEAAEATNVESSPCHRGTAWPGAV